MRHWVLNGDLTLLITFLLVEYRQAAKLFSCTPIVNDSPSHVVHFVAGAYGEWKEVCKVMGSRDYQRM